MALRPAEVLEASAPNSSSTRVMFSLPRANRSASSAASGRAGEAAREARGPCDGYGEGLRRLYCTVPYFRGSRVRCRWARARGYLTELSNSWDGATATF
eukprot:3472001-Pyramimonas_sp.AAC.1